MENHGFRIRTNLCEWSKFFHFFHYISTKCEKSVYVRERLQLLLPLYCGIKLSMLPVILTIRESNVLNRVIGNILFQLISFGFIGIKYLNLCIFSFVLVFTFVLIYYYIRMDKMILHHSGTVINFILEEIAPILSNYASTGIQYIAIEITCGHPSHFSLIISLVSYLILAFYTYIGASFRGVSLSITSLSHSFWKHSHYFYLTQIPNIIQQFWIIAYVWRFGLQFTLIISMLASFGMLYWCSSIPFITKQSNVFAINVFGLPLSILIAEYLYVTHIFSEILFLIFVLFFVIFWFLFLSPLLFNFFCWIIMKRTKFAEYTMFDLDNIFQLPNIKPSLFMKLARLLTVKRFKDLHAFLVAAIESDRDSELTLECCKMLMVHSIIPYHLRQKIKDIDIRQFKFSSKPLLCEIQYFIDKLNDSPDDVEHSIAIMEDMKQKTKIALYSFSNSLCDATLSKQRYTCALNYALLSQKLMDMAEYSLDGNPLSMELNLSFSDYLLRIGGDFIRNVRLRKQAESIKTNFIKTDDENHLNLNEKSKTEKDESDLEQILSYQRALDSISHLPSKIMLIIALIYGFFFLFPIVSLEYYTSISAINPDVYFNHQHAPTQFKIYFALSNIQKYINMYNFTDICDICAYIRPVSINNIVLYLNSIVCPIDNKPIFDGAGENVTKFPDQFINFMANQKIVYRNTSFLKDRLERSYLELNRMNLVFDSLIDRYFQCANNLENDSNLLQYVAAGATSFFVLLAFILLLIFYYNPSILKMVDVFSGIEVQTLEEFRSNLFITIHRQRSTFETEMEVDNDGALDLEEIEDDENNHFGQSDYTDLIEHSSRAPIMLKWYDSAKPKTMIFYLVILFILRYAFVPFVYLVYNQARKQFIDRNIKIHEEMDYITLLLAEINANFANISGVNGSIAHEVPRKEGYNILLLHKIEDWNLFVVNQTSMTRQERARQTFDILDKIIPVFDSYHKDYLYFEDTFAKFAENLHWILTFILFFSYVCVLLRFFSVQFHIIKNLKHLVLILHSKYTATVSIMMNLLSVESFSKKSFNVEQTTDVITAQLRDVVVFFDCEYRVTGMNQMASAMFGFLHTNEELKLNTIIPAEDNQDFYSFILLMKSPYGIKARRSFDFICDTREKPKTKFSGTLIPLYNCYAISMRDQTEIDEMKNELTALSRSIHSLLRRLVPSYITDVITSDSMPENIISDESAVLAMCLKLSPEYVLCEDDLDEADKTQVCISIVDRVLERYKNISRLRTFNGNFLFITSLFEPESVESKITSLLDFANDVALSINQYLEYKWIVTCTMDFGGPIYSCLTGISKTLFDVFGKELVECFDYLDIVPAGKILFTERAFEKLSDRSKVVPFVPRRKVADQLYILNDFIGMSFGNGDGEV